jgi:hypothetical protein
MYIGCVALRTSCSMVKSTFEVSGSTMSLNRYWTGFDSSLMSPRSFSHRCGPEKFVT